jgi:FkbM family methyltransferase
MLNQMAAWQEFLVGVNKKIGHVISFPVPLFGARVYFNRLDRLVALLGWKWGFLEATELKWFRSFLTANTVFIDIGGNMGLYSFLAASVIRTGEIHTFEPDPDHFSTLQKSKAASDISFLHLHPFAVSNENQDLFFDNSSLNGGDFKLSKDHARLRVKAIRLDDFWADQKPVHLIKMDIQGAELYALEGMTRIITQNPDLLIFAEFAPESMRQVGSHPDKLVDLLGSLGFHIYEIKSQLIPIPADALRKMQPTGYKNILLARRKLIT